MSTSTPQKPEAPPSTLKKITPDTPEKDPNNNTESIVVKYNANAPVGEQWEEIKQGQLSLGIENKKDTFDEKIAMVRPMLCVSATFLFPGLLAVVFSI